MRTPTNAINILLINAHLTYPGWSEGKLNLTFMDIARQYFLSRGHPLAETFVERGIRRSPGKLSFLDNFSSRSTYARGVWTVDPSTERWRYVSSAAKNSRYLNCKFICDAVDGVGKLACDC